MERFPEFVLNHILLFSLLAMILGLLIWNLYGNVLSGIKQITPAEAIRLINHEQAVVMDARSSSDFNNGHILNAIHVPAAGLSERGNKLEKFRKQAVIMVCTNGTESAKASRVLMQDGFESIYCLKGGVLAWRNSNLPLTRESG
ncbi:MAG: hypothetical protein A2W28_05650 [Gammaproteobacteria bacterium RBG_16_51_14]|nr:MAG: hypothetical protein A2W28_05650 [Gammaproteobacteria bacterium RBG_16_51_14]